VKPKIGRFKGLGEMNAEELKNTTLDPKKRRALRVVLDKKSLETIQTLMGKDPAPRFQFIMERAANTSLEELDV
jgi:DNA gyrase/topoisomerase IV subunit B